MCGVTLANFECVCYFRVRLQFFSDHLVVLQVLLVTSSRRPDHWIVPGGGVEPEEEASVTAIREVMEEAGVIGKLGRCLGVFEVIVGIPTRPNPASYYSSVLFRFFCKIYFCYCFVWFKRRANQTFPLLFI